MKPGLGPAWRTQVMRLMLWLVAWLLRPANGDWAQAMRAELAAIDDEREALSFAWGCLLAALQHAGGQRVAALAQRPQALGQCCAVCAVLLGAAFMTWAGAPSAYALMNTVSLAFALASLLLLPRQRLHDDALLRARACLVLGTVLLVAALLARQQHSGGWLNLGPAHLRVDWIALPSLLLLSAPLADQARHKSRTVGLLLAWLAMALQADPCMALLAAVVMARRGLGERDRRHAALALTALGVAAVSFAGWQAPAPARFIDEVPSLAFAVHGGLGVMLLLGMLLLLLPAAVCREAREHGWVWGTLMALSLPGWLPTPLLGFGGSLILAYVLSLAALKRGTTALQRTSGDARGDCRPGVGAGPLTRVIRA